MASPIDCLEASQRVLGGLSNGTTTLKGVYIYPDEYSSVNLDNLPVVVVSQVKGINEQMGDIGNRGARGFDVWVMEWLFYLSKGEHRRPSAQSATAELAERGWRRAVNDMVAREMAGPKFGGTVWDLGQSSGHQHTHVESMADHDYWDEEPYWTRLFHMQVQQIYDR